MSPFRLWVGLLAVSAFASDAKLDSVLKAVEARYNHAKTMQVLFREEYTPLGKPHRTDSGTLLLRRPGHMRLDYSQPSGKLAIADGKFFWIYTPGENRVEKMKLQDTEDMRAPLAFLLGELHFGKEFKNLQGQPEGADTRITAEPKSDNLPYSKVEFVVTSDNRIREVKVTRFDQSILDYTFEQEKLDPRLEDKLFQFEMPKGAEVVEEVQ